MTLTSILPTLRRSIPTPFSRDAWPARTVPTCEDVVVGGISVARYVELCGLPAVMTAPAVIPLSGGMPSTTASTTVLILQVSAARSAAEVDSLALAARFDDAVRPVWSEARLLARVSGAPDHRFAVRGSDGSRLPGVAVLLPADMRPGDLVAVPCPGAVGVGDIRPRSGVTGALADARPDADGVA